MKAAPLELRNSSIRGWTEEGGDGLLHSAATTNTGREMGLPEQTIAAFQTQELAVLRDIRLQGEGWVWPAERAGLDTMQRVPQYCCLRVMN